MTRGPASEMGGGQDSLEVALLRLSRTPVLLVVSDFDGTLAPIVEDPRHAAPHREAAIALESLARLDHTHVAVVSGRALADLAELSGAPRGVRLVGSHGSEFDLGFAAALPAELGELRTKVLGDLERIAALGPGLQVEEKPTGGAFHFRRATAELARNAVRAVLAGPASRPGVHLKRGKCVLELSVVATHKGQAIDRLRSQVGASAVLFFGDDVTDEDAFSSLCGPDVGVKVGPGASVAGHRVSDPLEVAQALAQLVEARQEYLIGADQPAIESLSLLSDLRTAALVSPAAEVVWFCAPRIDSPALFASLLGGPQAGSFQIAPADGSGPVRQHYGPKDLVLRTEFPGFTVIDYLDVNRARSRQRAGRSELVRVLEGRGRVRIRFAPRLDFGRLPTRLEAIPGGIAVKDSLDPVLLRAPSLAFQIVREGVHDTASCEFDLDGQATVLELRYGAGDLRPAREEEPSRRRNCAAFWSEWAEGLTLPAIAPEATLRSALTLRALCHGPSGAIAAAATTSLPETLGGVRNWDYRFAWPRDAAMAARTLVRLGSWEEGMALLDWLLGIVDHLESPERLRPIYTVSGGELGPEGEIGELCGYRGSRPVRVGNGAARQVQMDVFGPIGELLVALAEAGAPLSAAHWRLCEAMVTAVERRYREPDHGIWEIRAPARHHVHSKAMCWLALERGATLAEQHFSRPRPAWRALADQLAAEVLERGWNPRRRAFCAAYGSDDLDAAVLQLGLCGLLDPRDSRYVRTVDAIAGELREGQTVRRYRENDGLPGREGGFHLLTAWLARAYLATARRAEAELLFQALLDLAGPTGLLSEQYDPESGTALGNHPQAYSHLGLIELALDLDRSPVGS